MNTATAQQKQGAVTGELLLVVTEAEIIAELMAQASPQDYGMAALRVGLTALRAAGGQLDSEAIKREGDRILGEVRAAVTNHQQALNQLLTVYFDPKTGNLPQRFETLLLTGGQNIDSMLTKSMNEAIAPLLLQLDGKYDANVVSRIAQSVQAVCEAQNKAVLDQFNLSQPNSAICAFLRSVSTENGKLEDSLTTQIKTAVGQLSLDDESSALSRMQKLIAAATAQLSLDDERSGLARLRKEMLDAVGRMAETQAKIAETVAALIAQKQESARSTTHGMVFEDAVSEFVANEFSSTGCQVVRTGNSTGAIKNCKVGDLLVVMSPDHACAGVKIAIEAKESASYDATKAVEEATVARRNREASVCVFVFSSRTAPKGQPSLTRSGQDVFVVWNAEDKASDANLSAALSLAVALCVRESKARSAEAADFARIDSAVNDLDREIKRIDDMTVWSNTVKNSSEKLLDALRKSGENLTKSAGALREACAGLKGA